MSTASERKRMSDELSAFSLMTVPQLASFLQKSQDETRGLLNDGRIPFINVGRGTERKDYRIDPIDAAVFVLAEKAGMTSEEYWSEHGPIGTVERAKRYVDQIRRAAA